MENDSASIFAFTQTDPYMCRTTHDVAGFADDDSVADADVFFTNEILVVQGRAADGGPGKKGRFKNAGGCKHAGSADIDFDIKKCGFLLFGRIFICQRPARIFCGGTESLS